MTPDFPALAPHFARDFDRLCRDPSSGQRPLLHQFQLLFERWIPHHLLAQREEGPHSRSRRWNLRLTFWTFLWQIAQAGTSCREAVRQATTLCRNAGHPLPSPRDGPYCQARALLPIEVLDDVHATLVADAQRAISQGDLWCGRQVQIVDGTTVTLPDTPENQGRFPQQSVQRPGCGFPILRLTGLFNLATGLFTAWATGAWRDHELHGLNKLWEHSNPAISFSAIEASALGASSLSASTMAWTPWCAPVEPSDVIFAAANALAPTSASSFGASLPSSPGPYRTTSGYGCPPH